MSIKGKAYIAGIYEHPTRKAEHASLAQLHAEVAKGAVEDAGLTLKDVDAYFCAGDAPGLGPLNMIDYMGLKVAISIQPTWRQVVLSRFARRTTMLRANQGALTRSRPSAIEAAAALSSGVPSPLCRMPYEALRDVTVNRCPRRKRTCTVRTPAIRWPGSTGGLHHAVQRMPSAEGKTVEEW